MTPPRCRRRLPNGKSFRDLAVEELRKRADDLPGGSRVTVILSGPLPQTLAGPAVPWAMAESRLADWQPSLPKHRFGPAWDRAAQFADKSGEMLFLTDHLPPESEDIPGPMEVIAVGEALRNVAITTAEWTLDPSTNAGRVYLRVANFSGATTLVDVQGPGERAGGLSSHAPRAGGRRGTFASGNSPRHRAT